MTIIGGGGAYNISMSTTKFATEKGENGMDKEKKNGFVWRIIQAVLFYAAAAGVFILSVFYARDEANANTLDRTLNMFYAIGIAFMVYATVFLVLSIGGKKKIWCDAVTLVMSVPLS